MWRSAPPASIPNALTRASPPRVSNRSSLLHVTQRSKIPSHPDKLPSTSEPPPPRQISSQPPRCTRALGMHAKFIRRRTDSAKRAETCFLANSISNSVREKEPADPWRASEPTSSILRSHPSYKNSPSPQSPTHTEKSFSSPPRATAPRSLDQFGCCHGRRRSGGRHHARRFLRHRLL